MRYYFDAHSPSSEIPNDDESPKTEMSCTAGKELVRKTNDVSFKRIELLFMNEHHSFFIIVPVPEKATHTSRLPSDCSSEESTDTEETSAGSLTPIEHNELIPLTNTTSIGNLSLNPSSK